MKQYVERMIHEKEELEKKLTKAKAALEIPPYGMDAENKRLLGKQVGHMEQYLDVLKKRIEINI